MGKKVAIVGSGCSGLAALWALKSTDHEVHLFEADSRLGGHTNTVSFEGMNGKRVNVDTGFIVMNAATYPNFIRFLKHIGVGIKRTEMTFGVSRDQGKFEWAGTSLSALFAQTKNIFSPRMWRLIFDVLRFNQFAIDLLRHDANESENNPLTSRTRTKIRIPIDESIGDYLDREGYSQTFRDDYLIPMTAAVWSTSPDKCSLHFPAITLVRFMWNHHLLSTLARRPDWLTIPNGSKQYIDAVMADFPSQNVHLKTKVTAVAPTKGNTVILTANDEEHNFDHVILATHGDQALELLRQAATEEEIDILEGFKTSRNIAVLHNDLSLMPQRRVVWSAWNYITQSPFPPSNSTNISQVCLTYCMNILQHISEKRFGPVLVTLNPLHMPDPRKAQGIWEYSHPLYNADAIRSQKLLPRIQNVRGISYCGAWTKYGFHEDGFSSGLSAAVDHLSASLPFKFIDSTFSRGRKPVLRWRDHVIRTIFMMIHLVIVVGSTLLDRLLVAIDRIGAEKRKLG